MWEILEGNIGTSIRLPKGEDAPGEVDGDRASESSVRDRNALDLPNKNCSRFSFTDCFH